ncbi:MAG: hypothetical protein K2R93_15970 [Gemmatimonadaceae bacterium]|nr:hypothetical protein [Gemmatimonadaceae bacterium]
MTPSLMSQKGVARRRRALLALSTVAALLGGRSLAAQAPKSAGTAGAYLTRPERTDYAETSRYDDVIAYMKQMAALNPAIHLTTYGYTYEGRPMPLAVIGAPGTSPEQVLATKKTRVYIQGNIHAGEVEGKEAVLWLLRSIAKGERNAWFKNMVLLINPIYNADGNERVNVTNRGSQAGPVGGMGTRENAQGLDLNRDGTKLETAEARSMVRLLTQYAPHVAMDLHTTDGSSNSGFNMTYETSLNPNNAKGEMSLLREVMLPEVTKTIKAKHGSDWWYYGGVSGTGADRAWRSDADLARPRYTSTLFGVRNILGLLSETYSYASFKQRIFETYWFLEETLGFVNANSAKVQSVVAAANAESVIGQQLAVRQVLVKAPDLKRIVFAPTISVRNPYVPDRPYRLRPDGNTEVTSEMLPFYGTTEPTETSLAPRVWVIPNSADAAPSAPAPAAPGAGGAGGGGRGGVPGQIVPGGFGGRGPGGTPTQRMIASVIDRLEAHGIRYTVTTRETAFIGERFKIATNVIVTREYQGTHKARTLTGAWETTSQTLPAGSVVVPMDQPLARLLFILMDPRSDDGFMWWNILDPVLGLTPAPAYYPVLRSMNPVGN